MAKQTIGIGTVANDGTGDTIRDAFDKCNDNFTELYAADAALGTAAALDVDVDDTLAADSDTLVPSQHAVKSYVDAAVVGAGGASVLDDLTDVDAAAPADGDVLTWNNAAGEWQAATGGVSGGGVINWFFDPPAAADFATSRSGDATNISLSDDADLGLEVASGSLVAAFNIARGKTKSLPSSGATNWRVEVRLTADSSPTKIQSFGIGFWESSSSKLGFWGARNSSTGVGQLITYRNSPASMTSGSSYGVPSTGDCWIAVDYDAATTTYRLEFSANGKRWHRVDSLTKASITFTAQADEVGIFFVGGNNDSSGDLSYGYFQSWSQSW
jgi:hypothetical protein